MRSSNPVFSALTKPSQQNTGYGGQSYNGQGYGGQSFTNPDYGTPGFQSTTSSATYQNHSTAPMYDAPAERAITVDDIVTKSAITLGVITVGAVITFILCMSNPGLGFVFTGIGAIGGLISVLVFSFMKKFGSPLVTLTYAAFEGLFVGGLSYAFAGTRVAGAPAFDMIFQAVIGTLGVFLGMLYAYKSGAIKVTDKFRRIYTGALIGVLVLAIGNVLMGLFFHFNPLTNGGPIAIIFSLVCIGLAAMSFLTDFDTADAMVRGGYPASYAWGVALGLAVTVVWLYTEILRLLSYFNRS